MMHPCCAALVVATEQVATKLYLSYGHSFWLQQFDTFTFRIHVHYNLQVCKKISRILKSDKAEIVELLTYHIVWSHSLVTNTGVLD